MHVTIENLTINFAAEPVDTAEDTIKSAVQRTITYLDVKQRLEALTADDTDTDEEGI